MPVSQQPSAASKLYQRLHEITARSAEPSPVSKNTMPEEKIGSEPPSSPVEAPQQPAAQPTQPASDTTPTSSPLFPGAYKPLPEEVLLEWVAPSRPFRKPNKRFFTTITVIAGLIALILFFANQILPVAVVIAVVFLAYVLFSIPPGDVRHQLTTYGIRLENQLYYWEELGRFWFTKQYETDVLHIEVARFPNTLHLLLGEIAKADMTAILSEVLLHQRPPLTFVEKAGEWLKEKVPLDLES